MPAKRSQTATTRRTYSDIKVLSHDQVKEDLLKVGLKSCVIIQMPVDGSPLGRMLEAHERRSFEAHDNANPDTWLEGPAPKHVNPEAIDRMALYNVELERYLDGLTVAMMRKLLAEATDDERARTPARDWTKQDFATAVGYLLAERDQREFAKTHSTSTPTKRKVKKTNVKTRTVQSLKSQP